MYLSRTYQENPNAALDRHIADLRFRRVCAALFLLIFFGFLFLSFSGLLDQPKDNWPEATQRPSENFEDTVSFHLDPTRQFALYNQSFAYWVFPIGYAVADHTDSGFMIQIQELSTDGKELTGAYILCEISFQDNQAFVTAYHPGSCTVKENREVWVEIPGVDLVKVISS